MKALVFILILLMRISVACSQNKDTAFISHILTDSFIIKGSYKSIPKNLRNYLDEVHQKKFVINKRKFNSSDVNNRESTSRILVYAGFSKSFNVISYEHSGKGNHFHTIIFLLSDSKIMNVYNLVSVVSIKSSKDIKEFLEKQEYFFKDLDEM